MGTGLMVGGSTSEPFSPGLAEPVSDPGEKLLPKPNETVSEEVQLVPDSSRDVREGVAEEMLVRGAGLFLPLSAGCCSAVVETHTAVLFLLFGKEFVTGGAILTV